MKERIIEYFEGKMPQAESVDFLRQVDSDKELKKLFIQMQNTYLLLGLIPEETDKNLGEAAYGRFLHTVHRKTLRRVFLKASAYAATIALLVVGTWFFTKKTTGAVVTMSEVYVPAGQRARLTLDDGSVVWLNARSTLTYPSDFTSDRHVNLTGEAFFEVTHDSSRPFTVTAQDLNITVLGTKFNVNCYPENGEIQASLLEGSIRAWTGSGQEIDLNPYQQVRYAGGEMNLEPIEHIDYFLWTKGVYSFVNEPLSSIIKKLERYYDIKIVVKDLPILDYEYTGKFRQQDGVDLILRIIQRIHSFKFERKDDIIILSK